MCVRARVCLDLSIPTEGRGLAPGDEHGARVFVYIMKFRVETCSCSVA